MQGVTVHSQVHLDSQEELEVVPGNIFSNLEPHSSQQDGNMPVLYTGISKNFGLFTGKIYYNLYMF